MEHIYFNKLSIRWRMIDSILCGPIARLGSCIPKNYLTVFSCSWIMKLHIKIYTSYTFPAQNFCRNTYFLGSLSNHTLQQKKKKGKIHSSIITTKPLAKILLGKRKHTTSPNSINMVIIDFLESVFVCLCSKCKYVYVAELKWIESIELNLI